MKVNRGAVVVSLALLVGFAVGRMSVPSVAKAQGNGKVQSDGSTITRVPIPLTSDRNVVSSIFLHVHGTAMSCVGGINVELGTNPDRVVCYILTP